MKLRLLYMAETWIIFHCIAREVVLYVVKVRVSPPLGVWVQACPADDGGQEGVHVGQRPAYGPREP